MTGARDYAVLLLLAPLGLRAVEVSRLRLDDFDWRAGQIIVDGGPPARPTAAASDVGATIVEHRGRQRGQRHVVLGGGVSTGPRHQPRKSNALVFVATDADR